MIKPKKELIYISMYLCKGWIANVFYVFTLRTPTRSMYFVCVSRLPPCVGSIIRPQSVWPTTNPIALILSCCLRSSRSAHRTFTNPITYHQSFTPKLSYYILVFVLVWSPFLWRSIHPVGGSLPSFRRGGGVYWSHQAWLQSHHVQTITHAHFKRHTSQNFIHFQLEIKT